MKMNVGDPLAVLHLTSSKGFYGAERVVLTLSKYLARRGVGVHIACIDKLRLSSPGLVSEAQAAGLNAVMVPCRGRFDWNAVKRLCSLVQTQRINILHCHECKSRLYGVLVSRLTGVPIVATQHGLTYFAPMTLTSRMIDLLDVGCSRFCDKVITVASQGVRSMGSALLPSRRTTFINNGIDLEEFRVTSGKSGLKASLGIPAGIPVVGTVGRLQIEKGHNLLIEAARRLADMGRDVAYLFVGDGQELNGLQSLAQHLGLANRMIFAGFQRDVRPFLAIMDIFVLPSHTEGTPMALLEAMAMGKPVVVTPVGGVPDIVSDGVNGIVLRERNGTQLAEALFALLGDNGLARRLADQGRRRVESIYSAHRMAEQYESVYRECLLSRARSAAPIN